MIGFQFEVSGVKQVTRMLALSADACKNLRPVWDDVYDDFLDREEDVFDSEGGSGSKPREMGGGAWGGWAPLSPSYAAQKAAEGFGNRILVRTGRLKASLTSRGAGSVFRSDAKSMAVGTSVPYAGYHQTGTRKMPKREPIRVSEAAVRHWTRLIQKFVLESGQFQRENL